MTNSAYIRNTLQYCRLLLVSDKDSWPKDRWACENVKQMGICPEGRV